MKIKTRIKQRQNIRSREVADELSIGLSTVWLYAKQGRITPIKLSPRVTVFSIDEINKEFGADIKKLIEVPIKKQIKKQIRSKKTDKEMQDDWIEKNKKKT